MFRARRRLSGSLTLQNVVVYQEVNGKSLPTLAIGKVWVDLVGNAFSMPRGIRSIVLDEPVLRVARDRQHNWNILTLLRPEIVSATSRAELPLVQARQGRMVFTDQSTDRTVRMIAMGDLDFRLTPCGDGRQFDVEGQFRADSVTQGIFQGTFDPYSLHTDLQGKLADMPVNARLRDRLPPELLSMWDRLTPSTGNLGLRADLVYDPSAERSLTYELDIDLTDFGVAPPDLPFPLHDLHARLVCTNDRVLTDSAEGPIGHDLGGVLGPTDRPVRRYRSGSGR